MVIVFSSNLYFHFIYTLYVFIFSITGIRKIKILHNSYLLIISTVIIYNTNNIIMYV